VIRKESPPVYAKASTRSRPQTGKAGCGRAQHSLAPAVAAGADRCGHVGGERNSDSSSLRLRSWPPFPLVARRPFADPPSMLHVNVTGERSGGQSRHSPAGSGASTRGYAGRQGWTNARPMESTRDFPKGAWGKAGAFCRRLPSQVHEPARKLVGGIPMILPGHAGAAAS
jgi:hypothetical protein